MSAKSLPHVEISMEPRPTGLLVRVSGEIGLPPTTEIAERELNRVTAGRPKLVVLDLAQLTFMSSLGISLIANLSRALQRNGGTARVCGVQPQVMDVFTRTRINQIIKVFDNVDAAFAAA